MWLRDSLPVDIPGVRVFLYGYASKLSSDSHATLRDFSVDFLADLESSRSAQVDRVCTSRTVTTAAVLIVV